MLRTDQFYSPVMRESFVLCHIDNRSSHISVPQFRARICSAELSERREQLYG